MKKNKFVLYTGLDPERYKCTGTLVHIPFIQPVKDQNEEIKKKFDQLPDYESVLLTSRSAVRFFFEWTNQKKIFYVLGKATAALLAQYATPTFIAKEETAEGVCALLETYPPSSLFYPHAFGARPLIGQWLKNHHINHLDFSFYKTHWKIPTPLPVLADFDEVVFTSPSTVDAFLACYPSPPAHLKYTSLGPITRQALINKGL